MMIFLFAATLLLVFLLYRHFTWRAQSWPQGALIPPSFQGHRGYWKGGARENTLASFRQAAERGLKMVEMDVRLSRDGVVVVFHDADLVRLVQSPKKVADMTAEELAQVAQVCSLQQVLNSSEVPQFLNIELKTDAIFNEALERAVCRVIEQHQAQSRILFSSFNPMSIWRLSRLLPQVPRALLATKEQDPSNRFYLKHLLLAPYIKAHALHLDHRYVTNKEFQRWIQRKVPVAFWTVNDRARAEELLAQGAMSIISDTLV